MPERPSIEVADEPARDAIAAVRPIDLCGEIDAATQLSGAAVAGDFLVVGADEGHQLQILAWDAARGRWCLGHRLALAKQDQEADIEAITFGDGHLYVIGSHSYRRRRLRPDLSRRKNRERLLAIDQDPARCRLHRLRLDPANGAVDALQHIDLSKRLRKDPLMKRFWGIPSKENGIDIEGLAYRDALLYIGFRGPVLRDNYVPIMVLAFDKPKDYTLRFVRLDGQGVRDMVALTDGFLILSGPVNDAPGPFCLWWWDGRDQIPGKDRPVRPAQLLGPISTRGGAKAEGLALRGEQRGIAEVYVIYETSTAAQVVSMQVALPVSD